MNNRLQQIYLSQAGALKVLHQPGMQSFLVEVGGRPIDPLKFDPANHAVNYTFVNRDQFVAICSQARYFPADRGAKDLNFLVTSTKRKAEQDINAQAKRRKIIPVIEIADDIEAAPIDNKKQATVLSNDALALIWQTSIYQRIEYLKNTTHDPLFFQKMHEKIIKNALADSNQLHQNAFLLTSKQAEVKSKQPIIIDDDSQLSATPCSDLTEEELHYQNTFPDTKDDMNSISAGQDQNLEELEDVDFAEYSDTFTDSEVYRSALCTPVTPLLFNSYSVETPDEEGALSYLQPKSPNASFGGC